MKICVVGSGGREHALADALAADGDDVVVAPGNAGMALVGVSCTPAPLEEVAADLFVVGPEAPLVDGLADRLRGAGSAVFGPGSDGAMLEGSKAWMKSLLVEAGVPTAAHGTFTVANEAHAFLDGLPGPYVVKTDGLAGGKGVAVVDDLDAARAAVDDYLSGAAFGDAGRTVVIEEALAGAEVSVLAVCDGHRAVALAPARDYKRVGDGDTGSNTGGMGAYSPVPDAPAQVVDSVMADAVEPTLAALRARGIDYRGVLYAGLMLTADGPRVLEYNVRFGDPEAQVVLPRIDGGLAELLSQAASGSLRDEPRFVDDAAVTVVAACEGYPASPRTGDRITGVTEAEEQPGVSVFFAGVGDDEEGDGLVTTGGRVLSVTGTGASVGGARELAYRGLAGLSWPGMQYRTDIAARAAGEVERS
ncbi:MAG: phosphoribosylamine--glycine ligase [Acidimicrobiia bacterium]|nr:phosphoribosylamine--glycine ligase [Acidimicrobiia bacterium]